MLSEQRVPTNMTISDITALAQMLGSKQERQLTDWQYRIAFIFDSLAIELLKRTVHPIKSNYEHELFIELIVNLEALSAFSDSDLKLLVKLIPQLYKGMGR